MKTKVLFLLTVFTMTVSFSFAACSTNGATKKQVKKTTMKEVNIKPDSAAYACLGKTLTDVLFSPKKVKCYHVVAKDKVDKEKDIEIHSHFVRDTLIAELDTKLIGVLQHELLSDGQNYKKDSVRVRSPYAPQLVFVFEKKKEVAYVLVSLSDFSWSVVYDDKLQFNYNYEDKKAIKRFCDMFVKQ